MFNNRKIRELNKNEIIFGSQISTNNKNYFDIIKTIENTGNNPLKVGYCIEDKKHIALDLLTLNLLGMNDTKLKKIFISYSRQNLQYKDALKSHLSLLDRYGLVKAWSCDEMKAGTWHDQIQKELEEADIIIYMVSHEFMDSEYIMEDEVKKGIKLVEEDKSKKLICVLTGVCQWKNWSSFEKLLKENGGENSNFSSMDLSQFQFLPYHQYKNEQGIAIREEIVALEQWGRYPYDVINVAYNQIVNRVLAEIKQ
jgi:internalin A